MAALARVTGEVVITAPGRAECVPLRLPAEPAPTEVRVQTEYSLISAGTEGAAFSDATGSTSYPVRPGYAAVGRVTHAGTDFPGLTPGRRVFTYGGHASQVRARQVCLAVPEALDPRIAPFARLITVAMTALRVSALEFGDCAVVLGLGIVGNLCAQLLQLAGVDVLGVDPSEGRVARAGRCGVRRCLASADAAVARAAVGEWTGGQGVDATIEAVGSPALVQLALGLTGKLGEVILLGSPRGVHETDVTPLLDAVHAWPAGCITLKGAHEWRFPVRDVRRTIPTQKHSLERNTVLALRLLAEGRVTVEPLLTHVLPPTEAQRAFEGLRDRRDEYQGVVFDWTGAGDGAG